MRSRELLRQQLQLRHRQQLHGTVREARPSHCSDDTRATETLKKTEGVRSWLKRDASFPTGDLVPMEEEENINRNNTVSSVTAPSLFAACTSHGSLYDQPLAEQQKSSSSQSAAATGSSSALHDAHSSTDHVKAQQTFDIYNKKQYTSALPADDDTEIAVRLQMCFSFTGGRVTALSCTHDGLYCVAAFANGAIRLFDLSESGNADPEDRFGHQLGYLESTMNSMVIHLDMATTRDSATNEVICTHLFAGARQGSSTVLSFDLTALRRLHLKRGFISLAGGGLQVFQHSDVRLRGITNVTAVSSSSTGVESHSNIDGTYTATYRVICGRGLCSYHIWEVRFDALPNNSSHGSTASGGSPSSSDLLYRQQWIHLVQANVNAPILTFAHNLSSSPVACMSEASTEAVGEKGSDRCRMELIVSGIGKDARSVCFYSAQDDVQFCSEKPTTIKNSMNLYAASADGRVLFGGTYELIVSCFVPKSDPREATTETSSCSGQICFQASFSLSDFILDAVDADPEKKTSRHLREISDITCTAQGDYALICCSDNTILLYSVKDVTGKGSVPSAVHGAEVRNECGFIAFLFQASDTVGLKTAISNVGTSNPIVRDSCNESIPAADASRSSLPEVGSSCSAPSNVMMMISWWLIENPSLGGVIRCCHLGEACSTNRSKEGGMQLKGDFHHLVPHSVATAWLRSMNTAPSSCCALCGQCGLRHWLAGDLNDNERLLQGRWGGRQVQQSKSVAVVVDERSLPSIDGENRGRNSCFITGSVPKRKREPRADGVVRKERKRTSSGLVSQAMKAVKTNALLANAAEGAMNDYWDTMRKKIVNRNVSYVDEGDCILNEESNDSYYSMVNVEEAKWKHNAAVADTSEHQTSGADVVVDESSNESFAASEASALESNNKSKAVEPSSRCDYYDDIDRLRSENKRLLVEMEVAMRKADRRFELELAARRSWKQQSQEYEQRLAELASIIETERQKQDSQLQYINLLQSLLRKTANSISAWCSRSNVLSSIRNETEGSTASQPDAGGASSELLSKFDDVTPRRALDAMLRACGVEDDSSLHTALSNNNSSSSSETWSPRSYLSIASGIKGFLCVICEEAHADCVLQPCGHVCICSTQAKRMKNEHKELSACPFCSQPCRGIVQLQGVEKLME